MPQLAESPPVPVRPLAVIAALSVALAAPMFFVARITWLGWVLLFLGIAVAGIVERQRQIDQRAEERALDASQNLQRAPSLLRDLALIATGLAIVSAIDLKAELDNLAMLRFTLALGGAVAVPYVVSRYVFGEHGIRFPWRGGGRWKRFHWAWLGSVLVLGWLILPFYFITSGVYQNWPQVTTPDLIARLFVGVGAVGIWDELFFICTVFALLLRHFPTWLANILQAIVFVSFLWELGYQAWGPLLTIPFALLQGIIFVRTRSLAYVVTVHLLFDAVVFLVLVHAHNPGVLDAIFLVP